MNIAQNLSGTWVGNGDSEVKLSHHGNTLTGVNWGGPRRPNLRGTCRLKGGPKMYNGKWKNRDGEYRGEGKISMEVINNDVIYVQAQGTVYYRGTSEPYSDSGNMRRK